jgi:hypothetical protein
VQFEETYSSPAALPTDSNLKAGALAMVGGNFYKYNGTTWGLAF